MRGKGREKLFLEKPDEWCCLFEGTEVVESTAPLDFFWMLPLDGIIDHWGQPYRFSGDISAKARVYGSRSGFSVDLSIAGDATVTCARCLSDAPLEIFRDFRYFYKPLSSTDSDDDDSTGDEIIFLKSIEGEVDISDQVWESLILSLPEKVLCSPDCRGICPICGKDRNKEECGCSGGTVDPRFEILAGHEPSESENIPGKGGNQHGSSQK